MSDKTFTKNVYTDNKQIIIFSYHFKLLPFRQKYGCLFILVYSIYLFNFDLKSFQYNVDQWTSFRLDTLYFEKKKRNFIFK